jgi:hypothetical protein
VSNSLQVNNSDIKHSYILVYSFAVWTIHFIRSVKDQQMHHSFNVLVLNILLRVSAFQNAIIRDSDMNMPRLCSMLRKAEKDGSCIL